MKVFKLNQKYFLATVFIFASFLAFANTGDTTFNPLTGKLENMINGSGGAAIIAIAFILGTIYIISGGGMRAVTNMIGVGVFVSVGYGIFSSFAGGSVEVVGNDPLRFLDFRLLGEVVFAFGYFWLFFQNRNLQKKLKEKDSQK
jgi:hypothetical protein